MDNGLVCIMTKIHQVKGWRSEVDAIRNKHGPKSTNASGVRTSRVWKVGEWTTLMKITIAIKDYNFNMNGMDRTDPLRS